MKNSIMMTAFLAVLIIMPQLASAQGSDIPCECSCDLRCYWEYTIWDPACWGKQGDISIEYSETTVVEPYFLKICESTDHADGLCRRKTKDQVYSMIKQNPGSYCPDGKWKEPVVHPTFQWTEGACIFTLQDCPSSILLGKEDPRLDTLRQFRDKVLSKTPSGRKLIGLYYKYSARIVKIIAAKPALKTQAKELFEQLIPQIEALVQGNAAHVYISDSMQNSADILISEFDAGPSSPLQKQITPLKETLETSGLIIDMTSLHDEYPVK